MRKLSEREFKRSVLAIANDGDINVIVNDEDIILRNSNSNAISDVNIKNTHHLREYGWTLKD